MTMIAQERIDEIKNGKVFVQDNNDEINWRWHKQMERQHVFMNWKNEYC